MQSTPNRQPIEGADDDEFVAKLTRLEEALAGETPPRAALRAIVDALEKDADGRLARSAACLQRLHAMWPRQASPTEGDTTPQAPATATSPAGNSSPSPLLPDTLGKFTILRFLGRGGNGIVFQAFDPSLDRDVALKVPHLSVMLDARLRERFFQEGRAAAGLDHPNVVPVFEAGEIGPVCYIASAYCPARPWRNGSGSEPIRFLSTWQRASLPILPQRSSTLMNEGFSTAT